MLASRPQAGSSHTPLSTYHQSPPCQNYPHSHTYEAGPSYHPDETYFPPWFYYDDLMLRMGRMEVNQTELWDYSHRQDEAQDQRMGRIESQQTELLEYTHQQAMIEDQCWGYTQQYFQQQNDYWAGNQQ